MEPGREVTDLWRRSDSPAAFVSALAENGYILATGKRPFLLVDLYGHVNALPKLIDDREVRTGDMRAFLGEAYGPEGLPTVEEAQALAAQHRQALEDFEKARLAADDEDKTEDHQGRAQAELDEQVAALAARQRKQLQALNDRHKAGRQAARATYLAETRRIRIERARRRPKGLAAFLAKVSGVALIAKKVQRYRDRKRYEAFVAAKRELRGRQAEEHAALVLRHQLQVLEIERQMGALAQISQRERQSLETALMRQRRKRINGRHVHMPPFGLALDAPGHQSEEKAPDETPATVDEQPRSLADELNELADAAEELSLIKVFREVVADDQGETESGGSESAGGIEPPPQDEQTLGKRRRRLRERDRGTAEENEPKRSRKRRRKPRDHDDLQEQDHDAKPLQTHRPRDGPGPDRRR